MIARISVESPEDFFARSDFLNVWGISQSRHGRIICCPAIKNDCSAIILRFFEIARVLVRLDHVASRIVRRESRHRVFGCDVRRNRFRRNWWRIWRQRFWRRFWLRRCRPGRFWIAWHSDDSISLQHSITTGRECVAVSVQAASISSWTNHLPSGNQKRSADRSKNLPDESMGR